MGASAPVAVNRTVPKVAPPKTALEFSASPTPAEICRARVFEEPLVPIGGEPTAAENAALAAALLGYARRSGPDDFSSLTGFLESHPASPWRAALLTDLGLEYYNTAHYSLALDAWKKAWAHARDAKDAKGKAIADRAAGELAYMYARLGRMDDLDALLKSVENRAFVGSATEKITGAREGLWHMQHKPEISFKCGPYALRRILLSDQRRTRPAGSSASNALVEIFNFPSTQKGVSLPQVAELSQKVGLNYQMAFRSSLGSSRREEAHSNSGQESQSLLTSAATGTDFIVPSVVHWKVGHYAALVRQEGDKYLLEDPTFGNTVWATRQALEAETSGYFLIPPGELPRGWRAVNGAEGALVWGKGFVTGNEPDCTTCSDLKSGGAGGGACQGATCKGMGMAVSDAHLMVVSLNIIDTPFSYSPPVGPPVHFTVTYNQREARQPANFSYANFGSKWTCNWISYVTDNPSNTLADVTCYMRGGGTRTFTAFNTNSQTFAFQQFDQTQLKRTSAASYELLSRDGSKLVFTNSDGSIGTSRKVFLTQAVDPSGNAVTLTYDADLRLVALTDAIGQVTTVTYLTNSLNDPGFYLISRVTDPFGRFASFAYSAVNIAWTFQVGTNCPTPVINDIPTKATWLASVTDVLGLTSRFHYLDTNTTPIFCASCFTNGETRCITRNYSVDFIDSLTTPYGASSFFATSGFPDVTFRSLETIYPDGSRDRVEFNQIQSTPDVPAYQLPDTLVGIAGAGNVRNSFYWSRTACATAYGDYTKAKIFHWLHSEAIQASGCLSSMKEPLENWVFFNYVGANAGVIAASTQPTKIGRVLDDGQSQVYTYAYNGLGNVTNTVDPVGRTLSYVYASNGVDLLEVRQTRAANNELLFRATYNAQHRPLTVMDAAGQTNTFTYNSRGQLLTATNPKGETTAYTYDTDGYLVAVDGPLPGTNDTVSGTYDFFGRVRTLTSVSGYTLTFDYDAMDRVTRITHPDGTFEQFTYNLLDLATFRDRAGRQTLFEYDNMRELQKRTDPLNRVTLFDWCHCGSLKSLTDPMGRTTTWLTDVQGRPVAKQYADGSRMSYQYENTISRLHAVVDERQQVTQYAWNRDNTLRSATYSGAVIPTPGVNFTYDPDYERVVSMTDGTGTTMYSYHPITATPPLGAGALASVDGPLPDDTITYSYDELGRPIHRAINGVDSAMTFDAAGRVIGKTNALGAFAYAYDGPSARLLTRSLPNGQTAELGYGNTLQDLLVQRVTHKAGATPISEFLYGHDISRNRLTTWSQQIGAQTPDLLSFNYDSVNQLLSATVTNAGNLVSTFAYTYDPAGNRLTEQAAGSNYTSTYNGLNEISTTTAPGVTRSNEWDALNRLVAVNVGHQRTEFSYDGRSRMVALRKLVNGSEITLRRFVWCGGRICEERDTAGVVTRRFFGQGMRVESSPNAGNYFYTRDHLGSIRELIDASGNVRARYAYDPYGRRTKLTGDLDADFGFAGMFFSAEANLALTHFRAYDPELGRWLSRDPLPNAEMIEGPNLYAYVGNEPISHRDPQGLLDTCTAHPIVCAIAMGARKVAAPLVTLWLTSQAAVQRSCETVTENAPEALPALAETAGPQAEVEIMELEAELAVYGDRFQAILQRLPAARQAWQQWFIDLEAEYPSGENVLFYKGLAYPGAPQIIIDLEAAAEELRVVAPRLHGFIYPNLPR
jgi:RHS repeat-associated protein